VSKKKFLVVLILDLVSAFLIAGISFNATEGVVYGNSETNVSGLIGESITWTIEQSPIIVTGDIRVAEGATLTIEPGVTVIFADYYYLEVRGTLDAAGTADNLICFTSNFTMRQPHRWQGIRNWAYEATSSPYVRSKGNITLNYCEIEHSYIGVKGSLENDGVGNITSVVVSNSKFVKNGLGIHLTCREYSNAYGYIANNTLLYNDEGITIENRYNSPVIIVENNIISLNARNGINIQGHPYPGDTILRKNLVTGNGGTGISITGSHTHTQSHIILTQNSIMENEVGVYVCLDPLYPETLAIVEINNNNIYTNKQYDLKVGTPVSFPTNLNATNNYWGTTNSTLIGQYIYDFNDNWDLGTVDYIPFLNEPNPEAPKPNPELEPEPQPEPEQEPDPKPDPKPTSANATQISISVDTSSTVVGSVVNIYGILIDVNGNPIQSKLVTLSYSVTGNDWVPIGSSITNAAGEYYIQWINTASGTFTLKAEWIGDDEYLGTSATTTLTSLPYQNQYVFYIESNSTITALTFDATESKLIFTASGASGTTGYVKATIPKDLLYTEGNWSVLVDETPTIPTVNEDANKTYLYFTYGHSTKTIKIKATEAPPDFPSWALIFLILTALAVAVAIYILKPPKTDSMTIHNSKPKQN